VLSPPGDPAVLRPDGQRAADGANDLQFWRLLEGARSRPVLARKPSSRPGRYCMPLSRVFTSAVKKITSSASRPPACLDAGQVIRWKSWHRWTAIGLLAHIYLAVAVAMQRQQEAGSEPDAGLVPITVPELLRGIVIPPPRRDRPHRLHWSNWRRRHQHRARQAHQRWNAYAETTP
jgi:hypothetical protein